MINTTGEERPPENGLDIKVIKRVDVPLNQGWSSFMELCSDCSASCYSVHIVVGAPAAKVQI